MGHSQPRRIEERIAREVGVALALLGVVLIQTALLPRPLGTPPNLLLMLVICRSMIVGPSPAARWAFYGGLSLDLCANSTIGSHGLALLLADLVAGLPLARLSRENWLLPLTGTLFGACAYYIILGVTARVTLDLEVLRTYALVIALPDILVVLIPALPLFLFMRWIERRQRGEVPIDVY